MNGESFIKHMFTITLLEYVSDGKTEKECFQYVNLNHVNHNSLKYARQLMRTLTFGWVRGLTK